MHIQINIFLNKCSSNLSWLKISLHIVVFSSTATMN